MPHCLGQASRLVAHAAEVKEQADAPPATQSGADEYYEVSHSAQTGVCEGIHIIWHMLYGSTQAGCSIGA